jgi:acyl carrier protein
MRASLCGFRSLTIPPRIPHSNVFLGLLSCLQVVGGTAFTDGAFPGESMLLFSSTSSIWSQTGAAHYAAANAFLDGLASRRQAAGLPATSLQLGPFAGTGMAASHTKELEALGLRALHPLQLSDAAVAAGTCAQFTFARLKIQQFVRLYTVKSPWSLVDSMQLNVETEAPSRLSRPTLTAEIERKPARPGVQAMTLEHVNAHVTKASKDILGEDAGNFDEFPAGGFDSLSAVELASTLSTVLGLQLPGTLVFDYPSVTAMARHLHHLLAPEVPATLASGPSGAVSVVSAPHEHETHKFLGVTLAERISCNTLETASMYDGINTIPYDRWDLEKLRVRFSIYTKALSCYFDT